MFSQLREYWDQYGLEFLAGLSVVCILILYVYNRWTGAQGTFSQARPISTPNETDVDKTSIKFEVMEHTPKDSKLELLSKMILEDIFKRPFYKIRPNFLRNEVTGFNLELDLYNEDLKLAVEVQGDQHYKFNSFFHRNKEHFLNQRYRDEIKKLKCKSEGITLIEVPYRVGEKRLRSYILEQLRLEGFLL